MDNFGYVVLVIFIIVRILIAAGLLYLIVIEIRRYKKHSTKEEEKTDEDVDGKDIDDSPRSRN